MRNIPRHEIEYHSTSTDKDDHEAHFKVRRDGKVFWIELSPAHFRNSPLTTEKYLTYLDVLRSGEEVIGDLLVELAPPPACEPGDIKVSLQEYLFPEVFVFNLEADNEFLHVRRVVRDTPPFRPSFVRFDDEFLDELEGWTKLYDPVGIVLRFTKPEDALFKAPKRVLIDNGQIECFYKPCYAAVQARRELSCYRAIGEAGLYDEEPPLNLCRVHGVVMDECGFILGILVSYIDCDDCCSLSMRVLPDDDGEDAENPSPEVRRAWLTQIDDTLAKLHAAGVIWGDAKAENVLIDRSDGAWITDFGGGYTVGWVDEAVAGTVEGDVMGMERIRGLLIPRSDRGKDSGDS